MGILFRCEHCGKKVTAPDDAGGRRGKCPGCGQHVFVPRPADQSEEIPLTPEDPAEEQRRKALREEEHKLQDQLWEHKDAPDHAAPATPARSDDTSIPFTGSESGYSDLIQQYILLMAKGELPAADALGKKIAAGGDQAFKTVEQLAMQEFMHPALAKTPPTVVSGFFKKLLAQFAR